MSIQHSFILLCIFSFLTAFAAEFSQFTPEQQLLLSSIKDDPCLALGLSSIPGFNDDDLFLYHILAMMAHDRVKSAAKARHIGNNGEIDFVFKYAVVMDKDKGCVRVRVKMTEDSIWFVTYFYFNEKRSLLIHKDQGAIVFAGMPGSEFDKEKYEVYMFLSRLRKHIKYPEMIRRMTEIIGLKMVHSFEAVVFTSGGLQHNEIEVIRIDNGIQAKSKDKTWHLTIHIPNDQTLEVLPVGSGPYSDGHYYY